MTTLHEMDLLAAIDDEEDEFSTPPPPGWSEEDWAEFMDCGRIIKRERDKVAMEYMDLLGENSRPAPLLIPLVLACAAFDLLLIGILLVHFIRLSWGM